MIGFVSRSSSGLPNQIEALAAAADMAADRLDQEQVGFAAHVVAKATERLKHGSTHTLVALLGATGSGKSSVANALVGDEVATTGIRRPTTSSTLACFWGDADAQPLLDWLEVKNRHRVGGGSGPDSASGAEPGLAGLVLLDVPDHDSIAEAHRMEMERIAEHADMLLWVTDPEKYADKAMHDYLERLSGHGPVTAMVLNKADQLDVDSVERCRLDLKRLLDGAGLDQAPVISISATTGDGVDVLEALLIDTVKNKRAMVDRLAADTVLAAEALLDELGPAQGATTIPDRAAKNLTSELVDSSGLSVVTDAVAAGYRRDAARKTGWPFTRWVRRLRPHPLGRFHLGQGTGGRASLPEPSGVQLARSAAAVRNVSAAVSNDMPSPWPELIAEAASPDPATLNDRIDTAIAGSVRHEQPDGRRWWNSVGVLQAGLAVAAVVGAVWLGLLAFAGYLRLPELPTPRTYWDIPVPTGLLLGGVLLGLLVAMVSSRAAAVGAARRSRAVRRRAERAVSEVADELVLDPIRAELSSREDLRRLLNTAADR